MDFFPGQYCHINEKPDIMSEMQILFKKMCKIRTQDKNGLPIFIFIANSEIYGRWNLPEKAMIDITSLSLVPLHVSTLKIYFLGSHDRLVYSMNFISVVLVEQELF